MIASAERLQAAPGMEWMPYKSDVLLVAENGAEWSAWMEGCRERASNVAAILQSPTESLEAFSVRIKAHFATRAQRGDCPTTTIILGAHLEEDTQRAGVRSLREPASGIRLLVQEVEGREPARIVVSLGPGTEPEDELRVHHLGDLVLAELLWARLPNETNAEDAEQSSAA